MNELDENLSEAYRRTNIELISMVKAQQNSFKNIIVSLIALACIMSVTVGFIAYLDYKNNEKWICMWGSYEYIDVSTDGGDANYIGEDGIITNAEDTSSKEEISTEEIKKDNR